jgi:hypothetical protein
MTYVCGVEEIVVGPVTPESETLALAIAERAPITTVSPFTAPVIAVEGLTVTEPPEGELPHWTATLFTVA